MNTYQNQLRIDIERIDAEHPAMVPTEEVGLHYAERSGRLWRPGPLLRRVRRLSKPRSASA